MARKRETLPDNYHAAFPTRLRDIMNEQHKTQQDVANAIGKTRQAVGYYADGKIAPDWETLVKLSKFFEVSLDYLLGETSIKARDFSAREICEKTGLTEKALDNLLQYSRILDRSHCLSALLENGDFFSVLQAMQAFITSVEPLRTSLAEALLTIKSNETDDVGIKVKSYIQLLNAQRETKYMRFDVIDSVTAVVDKVSGYDEIQRGISSLWPILKALTDREENISCECTERFSDAEDTKEENGG